MTGATAPAVAGLVSVVVPTFNGERHLGQALESVLAQDLGTWELLVGDDGSTDGTVALAHDFASRETRIAVSRRGQNLGAVANVNSLLARARGEFVAILHQDDWWEQGFLSRMVALLQAAPGPRLATCAVKIVSPSGSIRVNGLHQSAGTTGALAPRVALEAVLQPNRIYTPGVLARSSLYATALFEPSLPLLFDWHMWIRAAVGGGICVTDEPLASWRSHPGNLSAGAARSNSWSTDLARMHGRLASDWAGDAEPYPGAIRALSTAVWASIMAEAWREALAGQAGGASVNARMAAAIAPSRRLRAISTGARAGARVAAMPGVRRLLPALEMAVQRAAAAASATKLVR